MYSRNYTLIWIHKHATVTSEQMANVSGDQFTCSSAAVEKMTGSVLSNSCLTGLPDLGLTWTSPISSNLFFILSTWRLDTMKMSATSAADLVFRLLMISTLVCGWIFDMLLEVRLHLTWRSGVLGFFLYTPGNVLITVFFTNGALICDWLNRLKHNKTFVQANLTFLS